MLTVSRQKCISPDKNILVSSNQKINRC